MPLRGSRLLRSHARQVRIKLRAVAQLHRCHFQELRRNLHLLDGLTCAGIDNVDRAIARLVNLTLNRAAIGDLVVGHDERLTGTRHVALLHCSNGQRTQSHRVGASPLNERASRFLCHTLVASLGVVVVKLLERKRVGFAPRHTTFGVDRAQDRLHLLRRHRAFVAGKGSHVRLTFRIAARQRSSVLSKAILRLHAAQRRANGLLERGFLSRLVNRAALGISVFGH